MWEQVLPRRAERAKAKLGSVFGLLTDTEVREVINLAPVNISNITSAVEPLGRHVRKFRGSQRDRLLKVQQMTLQQQCKYYRKLGFF